MPEGAPIPIEGTNDYRRDREGNVIVTRLNEQMCQEIAQAGNGIYVRVDNTNGAQKAISQEINKMAKAVLLHRFLQLVLLGQCISQVEHGNR